MTSLLYGLFADPESAQRGVDALRRANVPDRDVVIVSSEPFEEYDFGRRDAHTPMPWIAALGGLLGGVTGFWFVAFTQRAFPLPTGAMPIVPPWPNGVITYEMTMLGAILATLITLLISARSPRATASVYDPEVSRGKILVGVANPRPAVRPDLAKALQDAGAISVASRDT